MRRRCLPLLLLIAAAPAGAAEISTHVLDLANGVGAQDVPVTLFRQNAPGQWEPVARARTDANGRVRAFADGARYQPGTYKLQFDMSARRAAFFPEIDVVFRVTDAGAHYHVPVIASPYGYSTYRGN